MNKIEEAIESIKKRLPKVKEVFAVILYGSVARKDYSLRHSDIDLFIIMDNIKARKKAERIINDICIKCRVRIHAEYQSSQVRNEDQTLLWKMFEEGNILYSKGLWFMDQKNFGLQAFRLYRYDTAALGKVKRVMMSRALHGREGFPGIIDNIDIIDTGKGGLLARKNRFKDIESLFTRFGARYKIIKTLYA